MRWRVLCPGARSLLTGWLLLALGPAVAWPEPAPQLPSLESTPKAASAESPKPGGRLDDPQGILNLDIDQLAKVDVVAPSLNMEVSTVERQESTVGRTPAAVFVITNEMIRRSGVQTIPDALRLAPGVQVQQKTASEWAVSIRGFNATFSDKLLVQIDGRSVYTPIFGGVFWDVQDLVLEDVERIEVIRGPGATIWGANAVNGVINIITKGSKETQGGYFQAGAGTEQRGFTTARYGDKLGDNATYRLYGKWFDRDETFDPRGIAGDDWRQARTGFRIDWNPQPADALTLQGDYYDGYAGADGRVPSPTSPTLYSSYVQDVHTSGGNVLGRWTHVLDKESEWSLQWYYDRTERHDQVLPLVLDTDTIDIDFQYRFPLGDRHAVICGCAYRNYSDYTHGIPFNPQSGNWYAQYVLGFEPYKRADDLFSYFIQDQITLREDLLFLILGSKFEHNDYTGFEMQPTARVLWTPDKKHSIWGSVSRAVQTPTRLVDNAIAMNDPSFRFIPPFGWLPVFPVFQGDPAIESAEVIAYEAGMRAQPTKRFYWDLAIFYNDYSNLVGFTPGSPIPDLGQSTIWPMAIFWPFHAVSNVPGETYGFELAAGYELNKRWRLRGAYTFLRVLTHEADDVEPFFMEESNPRNQFYLWLAGDLGQHWFLDLIGRYVDAIDTSPDRIGVDVPSYYVMDVRLAYRPRPSLEWAVVGRNLLEGRHAEYRGGDLYGVTAKEVEQEVYGTLTYRF